MFYMCVFLMYFFVSFSNLYLYNTALSVLFCVNKDIIIISRHFLYSLTCHGICPTISLSQAFLFETVAIGVCFKYIYIEACLIIY